MEEKATMIESLFERTEAYAKTNIELVKLKAIDKSADVVSTLVSKVAVIIVGSLMATVLNIGFALWLGEILGKSYYGFFVVASFYALIVIILLIFGNKLIKTPVSNNFINQMLIIKLGCKM